MEFIMRSMAAMIICLFGILSSCSRSNEHSVAKDNNIIHERYTRHLHNFGEDRETFYYLKEDIIVENQTTYFPEQDVVINDNQTYYLNDDIVIEGHYEFPFHDIGTNAVIVTVIEQKKEPKINIGHIKYKVDEAIAKAREHRHSPEDFNLNFRFLSLEEIQSVYEIENMDYDEQEFYTNAPVVRFELSDAFPEEYFYFFQCNLQNKVFSVPDCPFPIKASELPDYLIQLNHYQDGEPVDFIVIDNIGRYAMAHIVPRPIKVPGANERLVTIEASDANRREFIVHLKGFVPYELCYVYVTSETGNHRSKFDVTMTKNGEGTLRIHPGMPCIAFGKSIIEVKGFTTQEILVTQVDWGDLTQMYPIPECLEAAVAL